MADREEALRKRLKQKAAAVARVLTSEDGKILMEALEAEFDGALKGATVEETMFNVGAREVVVYLRSLIKYDQRGDNVDPLS